MEFLFKDIYKCCTSYISSIIRRYHSKYQLICGLFHCQQKCQSKFLKLSIITGASRPYLLDYPFLSSVCFKCNSSLLPHR